MDKKFGDCGLKLAFMHMYKLYIQYNNYVYTHVILFQAHAHPVHTQHAESHHRLHPWNNNRTLAHHDYLCYLYAAQSSLWEILLLGSGKIIDPAGM